MSAGWALGAANDRPSHSVRAVFVISSEMGVNCSGHQPGVGRGWDGEPGLRSFMSAWRRMPGSPRTHRKKVGPVAAQVAKITMSPGGPQPGLQPDLGSTPEFLGQVTIPQGSDHPHSLTSWQM